VHFLFIMQAVMETWRRCSGPTAWRGPSY
jgi:hypothetical protein